MNDPRSKHPIKVGMTAHLFQKTKREKFWNVSEARKLGRCEVEKPGNRFHV